MTATSSSSSAPHKTPEQSLPGRWLVAFGESTEAEPGYGPRLCLTGECEGRPPALADDEAGQVIFDGVLYNRAELQHRNGGSAARESNDAGLILQVYRQRGEEVLRELKGIFTLLIFDRRKQMLLAVRDPMGIYPLFYAEAGCELMFSTSIESLRRHPRVSGEVNRAALADHLCHRWPDKEETFFASVRRVPPGHAMQIDHGNRTVFRYWDMARTEEEIDWIREDELERFDDLLNQAVNRCLALGPAAIYLSGGLDSVSVAAVAKEISRQQGLPTPLALSVVFPAECNEEEIQRGVAIQLGLPHVLTSFDEVVGSRGLLHAALEVSRQRPSPLMNVFHPPYHVLGLEAHRQGRRIILTGGGGDEWLGVSPFYAADLLRRLDFVGFYRLWHNQRRSYAISHLRTLRNVLWSFSTRPLLGRAARRVLQRTASNVFRTYQRWRRLSGAPNWVAPDPLLQREMNRRADQDMPMYATGSFYLNESRRGLDHPLVSWEFEEVFESGRRMGVIVLQPFWDAELIDFLYRIPPASLNRGGRSKGMVRGMLARKFPHLGFERQKKVAATGFFCSVCLKEGAQVWQSVGGTPALSDLGVVDGQALDAVIKNILAKQQLRQAHRIWEVLNLELWLRALV